MGTNYYQRSPDPYTEDGITERHLGKRSGGWTFLFKGDAGVRSFSDWLLAIDEYERAGWHLYDEYGRVMRVQELLRIVLDAKNEPTNHTVYVREKHPDHARECWLDEEGNAFCSNWFC